MSFLDKKFLKNPWQYVLQGSISILTLIAILIFMDVVVHTALIASLGATVFTVFTIPRSYLSGVRAVLGGYAVGISCGILFHYISGFDTVTGFLVTKEIVFIVFGALAVGAAVTIMVITNTEHAPAAGIALGLILNQWGYDTVVFMIFAVIFILIVKHLLEPILINLTIQSSEDSKV